MAGSVCLSFLACPLRSCDHRSRVSTDFILAACDVEGNFLVVKAYEYTTLLSCMLLDAWAIPVCILFSWIYMRPKYHWTQLLVRVAVHRRALGLRG